MIYEEHKYLYNITCNFVFTGVGHVRVNIVLCRNETYLSVLDYTNIYCH